MHGPEVFDTGYADWLIATLRPARVIVAGVMARTAAEESGLSVEFDPRPPSHVLRDLKAPVCLVNHGKTPESGRIFGEIIVSRLGGQGLIHIECADRRVYCWNHGDPGIAHRIAEQIGFLLENVSGLPREDTDLRTIRSCMPGEPVYVNGIVIGTATEETVVLSDEQGVIRPVSGLLPKPHGIEKLGGRGPLGIGSAWCKSGPIRKRSPRKKTARQRMGRVVVIDHCGHEIFSRITPDTCGILAIGDDTTAVCGHIGVHLDLPVFGVVDGDGDGIIGTAFARGSVLVETVEERDDDLGAELKTKVPPGEVHWDAWAAALSTSLGNRVRIIRPVSGRNDPVR
jgi:hypothetical protein